jgi:phosphate-selective porin OprO and OprP
MMKMKNGFFVVFASLALFCTNIVSGQESDTIRYNAYGQKVNRLSMLTESRNGILVFESKDQSFKTWFDMRVHFDGAHYFDKNTLNPLGSGVKIRRLRFAMKSILYKHWYGEVDVNFAGGSLDMKDAYIGYKSNEKRYYFKMGYFKETFSMETTTSSRYQTFIEEPYVTAFAPSRSLGLGFSKWNEKYMAAIGIHFNAAGNLELTNLSENANRNNGTDEGYSLTGRFAFRPVNKDNKLVHLGIAGSYRTPKTSWEYPNTFRISTLDMTRVSRKEYLDTDYIGYVESQILAGAELSASYDNFKFSSEYIYSKLNRETAYENVESKGLYASISCLLFGGKYAYNNEEAEFTQISRGQDWGDIELGLRFDYINLNDEKAQIMGGSANGYTAGITYHVNPNIRFMLDYTYINHDRYANGRGDLYVGTDQNGLPTSDYTKIIEGAGKAGDDYGFIQARIELDF